MKQTAPANASKGSLSINLFGPGMTALHKIGLAGLWMTLKAMEKEERAKTRVQKAGGSWDCTPSSVSLHWDRTPGAFFKVLFEESFKIDKNGLVWFRALDHSHHSVLLQEAILGSFLQHPDATWKLPETTRDFGTDGEPNVRSYRPLGWYYLQGPKPSEKKKAAASAYELLCDPSQALKSVIPIKGFQLPGGGKRHEAHEETELNDNPHRALCLFYAPVGAIYFQVVRRTSGVRPSCAIVLPEVRNLESYAAGRASFLRHGVQQLQVGGTAEAGLRALTELQAAGVLEDVDAAFCRVISFGTISWAAQQKTRVNLMTVRASSLDALRIYAYCLKVLPVPRLVRPEKGNPFWDVSQVPDLIAQNVSEGRKWWEGFANFVTDQERRDHIFGYVKDRRTKKLIRTYSGEKGGLDKMVENKSVFPEGPERTFVLACQEALRRHMGRKFGRPGRADWGNEFEKVRVSIARCKNLASLRDTITDFWSRGGSLQKGDDSLLKADASWWQEVLLLLDEKNWRKAKDLALLALASYPGSTTEQEPD